MFAKYLKPPLSVCRLPLSCSRSFAPTRSFTFTQYFRMVSTTLPRKPIFGEMAKHDPKSIAVVQSEDGKSFTYGQLLKDVVASKQNMLEAAKVQKLDGERVAFMVENGYDYVVTFLAILANQAIALPLSPAFPNPELEYILNDSQAKLVLSSAKHESKTQEVLKLDIQSSPVYSQIHKIVDGSSESDDIKFEDMSDNVGGMMLYTSGTTNRPKGVIIPTSALRAQCQSLNQAWAYTTSDRLLHVLPLHHIHGCMNALLTPLYSGSSIEFMYPFKPEQVWSRLSAPYTKDSSKAEKVTFLTIVPAIYSRLLDHYKTLSPEEQEVASTGVSPKNLRLNISGSAALPTPTKQAWTKISQGNVILERFGMTEIGMGISCGLAVADRVDGSVGWPLPYVEARLVDTDTNEIIRPGEETDKDGKERSGEIQIRGPVVFKEYWQRPEATAAEFVDAEDGGAKWFKTGDVAVRRAVEGAGTGESGEWAKGPMYFIHGRKSADIIKTGGEKVSALEIEREMLSLPQVKEVAVVGVTSEKWGQKVCAVVVLTPEGKTGGKDGKPWSPLDMRKAMKERLVPYKIPQVMVTVDDIPKNAMGKINKKQLVAQVWPRGASPPPADRTGA